MAGMFYSLQEAAEKLNKTEEEIKQLAQDGRLREFRDGSNLLFKVDEVDALASEVSVPELEQEAPEAQASEEEIPELKEVPEPEAQELEAELPEPDVQEAEELEEIPEMEESEAEAPQAEELEEIPETEELEAEILGAEEVELEIPEDEVPSAEALEEEKLAPSEEAAGTSEILLVPETGAPVAPSELTDADTALTGEGISVLGESDADYEITDDTLAETAIPTGTAGTGPEVPLEEIEGDVNLDSFGSGSGLLDLSLQADDTSLGGILDEIYTDEIEGKGAEVEEVGAEPAAAIAAEAGEISTEEVQPMVSEPAPDVSVALARPYIEAPPDFASNTLGILLFLPLLMIIYTMVVAVSGPREVMPSILTGIQGFIWYIMGGAAVVSLIVAGVAFMAGGSATPKVKKPKAPKAPKAPKVKKEKPRKEKPAKKAKEPKPKKPKKEKKKKR
jgi:excisionase family DNA binding protein